MKVKLIARVPGVGEACEIHTVNDAYGARLIEQGQAVLAPAKPEKQTAAKPERQAQSKAQEEKAGEKP